MATKIKKEAAQALMHAKAASVEAGRQGGQLATRLAQKTVKQAGTTVAQVRRQAVAAATKVADKVTGRAQKRKRTKVLATVVGAAAVAAAAGVAASRRRR
jgi:hypothetical protein